MNKAVSIAIPATAGVVVGFGVGWVLAARRLNKQFLLQVTELDLVYQDSLQRATKTGRYATVMGAAEAVLQTPLSDIQEEVESEATPMYVETSLPTVDEASNLEPDEIGPESDEEASAANLADFAERFKNRASEETPGVTVNGKVYSNETEDTEEEDDVPVPTVPGFVTIRNANGPYVISIDEYMEDDEAFAKQEMTYYEGDGILVDARNSIVGSLQEDRGGIDRTIGTINLDRWGSGTTDPDQFYIRNERLSIDVEVTRDKSTYTRQVLGIKAEDEIQRSMQKPLKMREGDGN